MPNTIQKGSEIKLILGDCLEKIKELPDNSVDSIVTDPPYGLSFMGKKWDYDVPSQEIWEECLRVLKPGGYLLAFAGTRTQHRMAVRIEDAGFEIRDMIAWVYGSGFPKSLNIGKAVDKRGGTTSDQSKEFAEYIKNRRNELNITLSKADEVVCGGTTNYSWFEGRPAGQRLPRKADYLKMKELLKLDNRYDGFMEETEREFLGNYETDMGGLGGERLGQKGGDITKGTSEWEGWETALKPAVEPISVCTKPLQVEHIFAIIIEDIWNLLFALGVTNNFNAIPAKLSEVVSSVQENAKINVLESSDIVSLVARSFTHQNLQSEEKDTTREDFAQENVRENGKDNTSEKTIQTGEVGDVSLMDISTSAQMGLISENTVLLWKNISEELLEEASRLTISTAIKKIIELKTLRSCLYQSIGTNTSLSKEIHPNLEPITVARKPLEKGLNVAQNCLKWGVGGINIDGCRVEYISEKDKKEGQSARPSKTSNANEYALNHGGLEGMDRSDRSDITGRFPANLIHDGSDEVVGLFPQTKSGAMNSIAKGSQYNTYGKMYERRVINQASESSAARFFYCAKASKKERNRGLEELETKQTVGGGGGIGNYLNDVNSASGKFGSEKAPAKNNHPTVKPIALMEYLVKLVSKEGHTVLDPFMGSGSTGIACKKLGRDFIGIELSPEYMEIAKTRIGI